jgi:2-keto-4-pentenoate hydratase/2-oxohepta-3-ene-1,7-dioic acid hydratase in catechol pathway
MLLLTHTVQGDERLAVAVDDSGAIDVADLVPDGPWTMSRLLLDPDGTFERIRRSLGRDVARSARPMGSLTLLAPVTRPGKVIGVGRNYRDHAVEEQAQVPDEPLLFAKLPSAIIGDGAAISWSRALTGQVDHEAELAVIIGRRGRDVAVRSALDHVLGYTCLNDVSARDLQLRDGQWVRAKSLDTFCPMGPWVVTADAIPDPASLHVRCRVNGSVRQDAPTSDLVHGVAELIAYCSRSFTLEPGDVIATGTPGGVGAFRDPPVYLGDGDVVEVEIDAIGTLRNPCRVVD